MVRTTFSGENTCVSADDALALLDNAFDVVVRTSNNGLFTALGESIVDLLGFTPEQLIGTPVMDLVHPHDRARMSALGRGVQAGHHQRFDVRLRRHDHTYRWMAVFLLPNLDAHGRLIDLVSAWRDIHDEVTARELATASLARWRAALDAMPDPYGVVAAIRDSAGTIVDFVGVEVNAAACRFTGHSEAELKGLSFVASMPAHMATGYLETFRAVLTTGDSLVIDRAPVPSGPDGAIRYYDVRAARIDADHVGFTWRDVTAAVEHERTRNELMAMAALADERDGVARDLHDGAIQHVYATGLLLRSVLPQVSEAVQQQLERVIDAHDDIIRELRATILGLIRPEIEQLTPTELMRHCVVDAERGIGFVPQLVINGAVDELDNPVLLQHVVFALREMLSNAARHAQATWVQVTVDVDAHRVTLEVADNGVGAQAGSSGGFGLSNLNRRAELLDGSFYLAPRLPAGTVAHWDAMRRPKA